MSDRYREALKRIPRGETRSFSELAAMAGRPGAARAAGRAVRGCALDGDLPWHRVVAADGKPSGGEARVREQLERLRGEGARPRAGESVAAWVRRCRVAWLGKLPQRTYRAADDARVARWSALQVEPLADERAARARGFRPADGPEPVAIDRLPRERRRVGPPSARGLARRLDALDWPVALDTLASRGLVRLPALLSADACDALLLASEASGRFDRRVEMLRKGYGVGIYRYWKEPLPEPLSALRAALYERLRPLAGAYRSAAYPATLDGFWRECRAAGQRRPSSILIQYPAGGVNHPHRDLYGRVWFPFQALLLLSRPQRDFAGGEFVLIEEQPAGDRRHELSVGQGDVVVFGSRERLERRRDGRRTRVPLLHAMNAVTRGEREAVGLVFHLAE